MLDKSLKDAESACELEDDNIKAHYICGCTLAEIGKKDSSKLNKSENRLKKGTFVCMISLTSLQNKVNPTVLIINFDKAFQAQKTDVFQIKRKIIRRTSNRKENPSKSLQAK